MKGKLLIGFTVAAFSLTNIAHADFTLYSSSGDCKNVSGKWSGSGKASHWLIGDCFYNGSGIISEIDSAGHFTLDVISDKSSGSRLCPQHTTYKLTGVCINGAVTVQTEYGNLTGFFSEDSGSSEGKLNVSPGVEVNVSIQFKRSA